MTGLHAGRTTGPISRWCITAGSRCTPEQCAPGVLEFLEPVRERDGLVLEFGCGSGLLTERLVDAGQPGRCYRRPRRRCWSSRANWFGDRAEEIRRLTLPDDPLPPADAIVGIAAPAELPRGRTVDRRGAGRDRRGIEARWAAGV